MGFENYDEMTGLEKCALLLNVLGNSVTSQIFQEDEGQ
jgi:hypothetical protein